MDLPDIRGVSDPRKFIATRLPQLSGSPNLYALFANYNNLSVSIGAHRSDLDIVVQVGYDFGFDAAALGMTALAHGDFFTAVTADRQLRSEGARAQHVVEEKIGQLPSDRPILAVIYAGLSAWREALDFASHIKEQSKQAVVVMVTCNCRMDRKMPTFIELLAAGKIDDVVVDVHCGGHDAMNNIINSLVQQHPPDAVNQTQ